LAPHTHAWEYKPRAAVAESAASLAPSLKGVKTRIPHRAGILTPFSLKIDPAILRDDLLEFLRGSGCLALAEGSNAIEARLLNSVSDRHDRAVLTGLVESWRARHRTRWSR
jgi:hypothetical protein